MVIQVKMKENQGKKKTGRKKEKLKERC